MTPGTAIHQASADSDVRSDIAYTVLYAWTLALRPGELALEKLTTPANGARTPPRAAGTFGIGCDYGNAGLQKIIPIFDPLGVAFADKEDDR